MCTSRRHARLTAESGTAGRSRHAGCDCGTPVLGWGGGEQDVVRRGDAHAEVGLRTARRAARSIRSAERAGQAGPRRGGRHRRGPPEAPLPGHPGGPRRARGHRVRGGRRRWRPRSTVPPDPTAGAFFDVDNTVIAGRVDLPLRPRAGRAQVLHQPRPRRLRLAAGQVPGRRQGDRRRRDVLGPGGRAGLRRRQAGGRDRRALRGDLRRADGRADLVRHPGTGPACTSTPASGSGWSPPRRSSWPRSSPAGSAAPARSARSPRSWTACTPGGWSASRCTARRRPRR